MYKLITYSFCLLCFLFTSVLILPWFFFESVKKSLFFSIVLFFVSILVAEIAFRLFYKIKFKTTYQIIPKVPFKNIYVEPHPYLPYVKKKHFISPKKMSVTYPLNKDKGFLSGQYRTNNFRTYNGPEGDRDIAVPKPEGLIRVNCLGGSTTGNYIVYKGKSFSYPMELEIILQKQFPDKKIEVNNFGQGGWTSAELLIMFLLETINTKPDIVIIYHAYNDLPVSLTPGFQSDFSHAKRNLGETFHLYRLASFIPHFPLAFYNFFTTKLFYQHIRYSLLESISKGRVCLDGEFKGTTTYKRNIEFIINICNAHGIYVVLSTYAHHLYDEIKNSKLHKKYREGVILENRAIRELAEKYCIPLVDSFSLIPSENKYFVDSVHFSPEGMNLLARNISPPVIEFIRRI